MSTPTLGDLLRQAIDRNVVAEAKEKKYQSDKERLEREHNEDIVRTFFEEAKTVFTSAILAGNTTIRIQVGDGKRNEVASLTNGWQTDVNTTANPYFPFWKDFSDWAASQGLTALWSYEHDGGGMRDWRSLSVTPKTK
jgi:hypothetical protein